MTKTSINLAAINSLALQAGQAILEIYHHEDFSQVVFKDDNSPLTLADRAAHEIIVARLKELYPSIPIISEEGRKVAYEERKDWEYFWLVDPLDGTKEFIKRNGQFTVNIALIHHDQPVLGVIYAPVSEELYYAAQEGYAENLIQGAYKQLPQTVPTRLRANTRTDYRIAVRSSSHASEEEVQVLTQYSVTENFARGSSLKFCMIAEGRADIYYRHGPTMEWDTAAGQALVEQAGGKMYQGTSRRVFSYNKASLRNESFLVLAAE